MIDRETIGAIRFGYGFRPGTRGPVGIETLMSSVPKAAASGLADWQTRSEAGQALRNANQARRDGVRGAQTDYADALRRIREIGAADARSALAAPIAAPVGFGERLVAFWANHFTVAAANPQLRLMAPDMVAKAIRPHLGGRFADMLRAVTFHPAMLTYLNQIQSVGPNSVAGQRRGRGLNENLARELIELHTLGVSGSYDQGDVRNLAGLMTGLSVDRDGFRFRPGIAEPGKRDILGRSYGARPKTLGHIEAALEDIAVHADTSHHLAEKLIAHFVGRPVPVDWAEDVALAFRASGGDLSATYRAFLNDDRAWAGPLQKAKWPFDFIVSALRAANARARDVHAMAGRDLMRGVLAPLEAMGQPFMRPGGPDGWDETPDAWITPAGLAARIRWAGALATRLLKDRDPREFLAETLHGAVTPTLSFAVNGAESRTDGVMLVLASAEFNRR